MQREGFHYSVEGTGIFRDGVVIVVESPNGVGDIICDAPAVCIGLNAELGRPHRVFMRAHWI